MSDASAFTRCVHVLILLSAVALGLNVPLLRAEEINSDQLLEQLRGDDFDARQSARDKLRAMGESARPVLIKALASDDPDIRQVALQLLANLKKSTVKIMAFDRDGNPLSGAEADVRYGDAAQIGMGGSQETNCSIVLNKSGSAEMTLQPPGPVNFYVNWKAWTVTGTQPLTWPISFTSGTTPLIYTLAKFGTLTLKVTDAGGHPLKDARVSLYNGMRLDQELLDQQLARWAQALQYTAPADDKGVAKLEHVPEGVYQVIVRADNYLSRLLPPVRVREGLTSDAGAVALTPGAPGKVQFVLKRADGSPSKGKTIEYSIDPVLEGPRAAELRKTLAVLHQWNGRNRQQSPAADASGKFLIENVLPGKYELVFRCDQKAPQHLGPFEVKSGQTLDLGEYKEIEGGSVSGKITSPGGSSPGYVYVSAVPEQEVIDALMDSSVPDWRYARQDSLMMVRVSSQSNGSYDIKELLPGRYAICMVSQMGAIAYIFGVNVTSGKAIQAPDIEMGAAGKALDVQGRVTLPDGKPAAGANVWMTLASQNSWSATCDNNGVFRMTTPSNLYGSPISLGIRAQGYKPFSIDLVHSTMKLDAITAQLQKQDYGSLRVKVVDEAGKPLPGASVAPAGYSAPNHPPRKTNSEGLADLSGLATGTRTLTIECDGYFVHEPKVVVEADKENEATIVMHKGYALHGRVAFPAGTAAATLAVMLSGPSTQSTGVDADGRFKFEGLTPGEYTLAAAGPALIVREPAYVTLKAEQPEIPETKLELVRASGVALNLGAAYEGYSASIVHENEAASEKVATHQYDHLLALTMNSATAQVDAAGRVEFWGLVPGTYDLHLSPPQRTFNYYGRMTKSGNVTRIVHAIHVPELKSAADLKTAQAQEVKLEPGDASIVGRLELDNPPSGTASAGNLVVTIEGVNASSSVSYVYPQEFRAMAGKVIFAGTVPNGVKPPEHGQFNIAGLPAGQYTVKAELNLYRTRSVRTGRNSWTNTMLPDTDKHPAESLKTFTLKAGEHLDLGAVTFKLPDDSSDPAAHADEINAEDQVPSFQP